MRIFYLRRMVKPPLPHAFRKTAYVARFTRVDPRSVLYKLFYLLRFVKHLLPHVLFGPILLPVFRKTAFTTIVI